MKKRILNNSGFSQVLCYISLGVLLALLGTITTAYQNVIIGDNSKMSVGNPEKPYEEYSTS